MVLELKEYTMASLGYKSSENPLISPNQTCLSPPSLQNRRHKPPPFIFFFIFLLHFLLLPPPSSSSFPFPKQPPWATAAAIGAGDVERRPPSLFPFPQPHLNLSPFHFAPSLRPFQFRWISGEGVVTGGLPHFLLPSPLFKHHFHSFPSLFLTFSRFSSYLRRLRRQQAADDGGI